MSIQGKWRHLEWIELEGGVVTECAVMKRSPDGHTWFFPVASLDIVDKQRLLNILRNRNAELYELWDMMSQITLGNGVNALTYFNQLVKVRTPQGQVLPFGSGQYGTPVNTQQSTMSDDQVDPALVEQQLQQAVAAAKRTPSRAR
jgi:hypothetical protein